MLYKIDFKVDDGNSCIKDIAIVEAPDPESAKNKLKQFVENIDSETCITEIFQTKPFVYKIFTARHGYVIYGED